MIVVHLFDIRYLIVLIQVEVELRSQVVVNAIILRCDNCHVLFVVHQKELRLPIQWNLKLNHCVHLLLHEI